MFLYGSQASYRCRRLTGSMGCLVLCCSHSCLLWPCGDLSSHSLASMQHLRSSKIDAERIIWPSCSTRWWHPGVCRQPYLPTGHPARRLPRPQPLCPRQLAATSPCCHHGSQFHLAYATMQLQQLRAHCWGLRIILVPRWASNCAAH